MKILLIGEYSGFYKNLKIGLASLGHDVTIASSGDGYKAIKGDINYSSALPGIAGKIAWRLKAACDLFRCKNYDVVQLVNPFLFPFQYFPNRTLFRHLAQYNAKFFLSAAGDDARFWKYGRALLRYGPFDDFLKYDKKRRHYYMESAWAVRLNDDVINICNGIIPVMYEYQISYEGVHNRLGTIPLPLDVSNIAFTGAGGSRKIRIFHGLNRYGAKGTRHVKKAFKYLNEKYPHDVECIIDGHLPLQQYLQLMRQTDVIVDQTYSYSLGMNGIYALAMGKIVMGGAEPESLEALGVESSPIINILPDASSIIKAVESLLDERHRLQERGQASRLFAESVHDAKLIAKKYVQAWQSPKIVIN